MNPESAHDLDTIRAALSDQAEDVARALLGDENRRLSSRRELRFFPKGGLSLALRGRKRGFWFDHGAMQGGDLLSLVRREIGCDFPEAIAWARRFLGWPGDGPVPEHVPRVITPTGDATADADELAGIKHAREIWASCGPVENTLAEIYLAHRGMIRPACGWPASIGYHPRRKALVVAVTDDAGDVVAIQAIHLDTAGRKAKPTPGRLPKWSRGPVNRGAVRLPGIEPGPVVIAEGPETALSIWTATGLETWVALGSTASIALPDDVPVIVARDDDQRGSPADKAARKALKQWQDEGRLIAVAWPWQVRRGDKSDFNDVLMTSGRMSVRARIQEARRFLDGAPTPPPRPRKLTLIEARQRLDAEVGSFFERVLAGDDMPPQALRVTLGTGKTHAALKYWALTLTKMRQAGDKRSGVVAVPEHRLGRETVERANKFFRDMKLDLRAAAWRGRQALNPDADDGETMCRNLEKVKEASALLLDPEKAVCETCPFASDCAYLGQRNQKADLWVAAHSLIFTTKPATIPDVAGQVIDETPYTAALIGVDGKPISLPLDALTDLSVPVPDDGVIDSDGADLRALRAGLHEALSAAPDGPIHRDHLARYGFSEKSGDRGVGLEKMRIRKDGDDLEPNRTFRRFAMLWEAVAALMRPGGPTASGWMELARDDGVRVIHLRGRRKVAAGFQVPTLLIDANLDAELLRCIWPDIQETTAIEVETPHMKITQCADLAFSKKMLAPLSDKRPAKTPEEEKKRADETRRRSKNRRDMHARLYADTASAGGEVLIVSNKSVTDELRPLRWPDGVAFAHFNATAGRDEFRNVSQLTTLGRPMPPPRAVERMAEALTGAAGERIEGFYPSTDASRILRDGRIVQAETPTHPDETVRRILTRIVGGEIEQAIGRGRGVERTAENPLHVIVYTDVVVGEVDELIRFEKPSPAELMLAAGGVVFESPAHAVAAYPKLWPSRTAASMAFTKAARCVNSSNSKSSIREIDAPLSCVRYQIAGMGQRPALAHIEPGLDPREALAALLGPVTLQVTDDADTRPVLDALPDVPGDAVPVVTPDIAPPLAAQPFALLEPETPERLDVTPVAGNDDGPDQAHDRPRTITLTGIFVRPPPVPPSNDDDAVERFRTHGGIIPASMIPAARRLQRESGFKQSELAARVGISRPQLANALQSRFGLSPEPAARLVALIEKPPKVIAPLLI